MLLFRTETYDYYTINTSYSDSILRMYRGWYINLQLQPQPFPLETRYQSKKLDNVIEHDQLPKVFENQIDISY